MLVQLIHNGVVVPDPAPPQGLALQIRSVLVVLTPKQEEMALAWAKKQDTPYVRDKTFVRNFMADLSRALGLEKRLSEGEVDFGPAFRHVLAERSRKEQMGAEERKALAAERKSRRQALAEQHGYALVNGERVSLAGYVVEPSGIFMGRGQHPLRGRWKEGARHEDIALNLSPDAPQPPGAWGEVVWQPESLWVARWQDKLSGKMKYVWLGDTARVKQVREARKYDKAHRLHARLESVRARIEQDLSSPDARCRMIATACYLIDALCLRVGDEKDPDEADTVGATTLRPEHVRLHPDGTVEFEFLGKDSVEWHKKQLLPEAVRASLSELRQAARPANPASNGGRSHPTRDLPQLFPDIDSQDVNAYLGSILPGLTAKVFRTHHATIAVRDSLEKSEVGPADPDYRKWQAASSANLEAAMLCNHTRQAPANWSSTLRRMRDRLERAKGQTKVRREQVKALADALKALKAEAGEKSTAAPKAKRAQVCARYAGRIDAAKKRLVTAESRLGKARLAQGKLDAEAAIARGKRAWNLGTSLRSYIDPRVFHAWGERVGYDVLDRYYPQALRQRFGWVRDGGQQSTDGEQPPADPE